MSDGPQTRDDDQPPFDLSLWRDEDLDSPDEDWITPRQKDADLQKRRDVAFAALNKKLDETPSTDHPPIHLRYQECKDFFGREKVRNDEYWKEINERRKTKRKERERRKAAKDKGDIR